MTKRVLPTRPLLMHWGSSKKPSPV